MSAEQVEDLGLARFCRCVATLGDWHLMDRRRYRREMRKLPARRAAARAAFHIEVAGTQRIRGLNDDKPHLIIIDDLFDESIDMVEFKRRALTWYDQEMGRRAATASR